MGRIFWNNKIVICKSHHIPHLECGEPYKVLYESWREFYYVIKNDNGKAQDYSKEHFRKPTKSELRELRLGKLLDN